MDGDRDSASDWSPVADRFYRGTIESLSQGTQRGVIRSANGREVPFSFAHVVLVGQLQRCEDLSEGMSVGFDVSQTSNGLVVAVICPGD